MLGAGAYSHGLSGWYICFVNLECVLGVLRWCTLLTDYILLINWRFGPAYMITVIVYVIYAPPLVIISSELMWPSGVLCTQSETVELSAHRLLYDTSHNTTSFGHSLKTFFSLRVLEHTAHSGFLLYTNPCFTYVLCLLCHVSDQWRQIVECLIGGTAAAAPPPFRLGVPAFCGSHPLVTPY